MSAFPGFAAANMAARFQSLLPASNVQLPPWNLNTNTVTITAWINPIVGQAPNTGLVLCRGGGTVAGLNHCATANPLDGLGVLGYNWNNDWEANTWYSGLTPPAGQWSFVALVVTPTNATIHLMTTNGLASATHPYPHVVQSFAGTSLIGDDSAGANGVRIFNGAIDDVAVLAKALSKSHLVVL